MLSWLYEENKLQPWRKKHQEVAMRENWGYMVSLYSISATVCFLYNELCGCVCIYIKSQKTAEMKFLDPVLVDVCVFWHSNSWQACTICMKCIQFEEVFVLIRSDYFAYYKICVISPFDWQVVFTKYLSKLHGCLSSGFQAEKA